MPARLPGLVALVLAAVALGAILPSARQAGVASSSEPLGSGTVPTSAAPAAEVTGWALHTNHAGQAEGPAAREVRAQNGSGGTTYEVCNTNLSSWWEAPCFNYTLPASTFCAAMPMNATLANTGLNLSVASSPASGYSAAPALFRWNASVNGGGMPPYLVQIFVYNAAFFYNTTNLTGAIVLAAPGLYAVDVLAFDSSCSQTAMVAFDVEVYGSLGAFPLHISASASNASVPSTVTYRVNTSALPANVTVTWLTGGTFGQSGPAGIANLTYFVPGTYAATACLTLLDANNSTTGIDLACNSSAPVALGGALPVTTSVSIGSGAYPVNVTYNVSINPNASLPANTSLYLIAYDAQHIGTAVDQSNGTPLSLSVGRGCGVPWTTYVPPSGICSYEADWSLIGPLNGVDAGFLGIGPILANLTANGSPTLWNPAVSWTHGPLNGSLPLNLTVNLSVSGGMAPYSYSFTVYGRSSGAAAATLYPTLNGTVYGWNGSAASVVTVLSRSGVYFASYFVADANDNWVGFSLPLIVLGNVSPLAPLGVLPGSSSGGATLRVGGTETFVASPIGGAGPYAVQWNFGDGSFASSLPGAPVEHVYTRAGTFIPSVTVTDARGRTAEAYLPAITVLAAPSPSGGTSPLSGRASSGPVPIDVTPLLVALGFAAVLSAVGIVSARRELERQGEELVATLTTLEPPEGGLPPSGG